MVGVDARAGVVTLLAPPCAGPGHLMWQRVPPPVLAYPCALTAQFAKNASPGHAFAIWYGQVAPPHWDPQMREDLGALHHQEIAWTGIVHNRATKPISQFNLMRTISLAMHQPGNASFCTTR